MKFPWTLTIPAVLGLAAPLGLRAEPAGVPAEVTFTKDIAPIVQRSCENCHRPRGVAPMSLATYEDARPWARAIKVRTSIGAKAGVMPPCGLDTEQIDRLAASLPRSLRSSKVLARSADQARWKSVFGAGCSSSV
jgi:mono/diheme cytochrome c family protein